MDIYSSLRFLNLIIHLVKSNKEVASDGKIFLKKIQ
jgi:hypothetical protein